MRRRLIVLLTCSSTDFDDPEKLWRIKKRPRHTFPQRGLKMATSEDSSAGEFRHALSLRPMESSGQREWICRLFKASPPLIPHFI